MTSQVHTTNAIPSTTAAVTADREGGRRIMVPPVSRPGAPDRKDETRGYTMAEAMPFLTFQPSRGRTASEAIALYTRLFDDGQVLLEQHRPADAPQGAGTIELAEIVVAGGAVRVSGSYVEHAWGFTPPGAPWGTCGPGARHPPPGRGAPPGGP